MLEASYSPPALLAHSAVVAANVATVRCLGPDGETGPTTTARLVRGPAGALAVRVDRRSAVAIHVVTAPEVAVDVMAPAPYAVVRLNGYAARATAADGADLLQVSPTRIRLVGPAMEVAVAVEDFAAAAQHPVAAEASRALEHLAEAHSDQLLACVRAHVDHSIEWAEPRALDSFGLSLTVLTPDGVGEVTLAFPGAPVASLKEAARHIGAVLTCPCHSQRRSATDR